MAAKVSVGGRGVTYASFFIYFLLKFVANIGSYV